MDAKWIPVLAAGLGVLGGVCGALVGGFVANSGRAQEVESEREAQREDRLLATYSEYAAAVDVYLLNLGFAIDRYGVGGDAQEDVTDYLADELEALFAAEAAVKLVAGPEVEGKAMTLTEAITHIEGEPPEGAFDPQVRDFIDAAEKDIESGG
jgi:hypothetical protein